MTPHQIRVELYMRRERITQADIARSLGVTRAAITSTINRVIVSRRIMEAIAKAIGLEVELVFPEQFKKKAG